MNQGTYLIKRIQFEYYLKSYELFINFFSKDMFNTLFLRNFFSRNKRFVGGNWKSNNGVKDTKTLMENTINKLNHNANNVDVVIAPVFLHIPLVQQLNTNAHIKVAAQNSSNFGYGAYTGEVSPKHLKDIGLQWVILGHSERRTILKETDDLIVSKTKLALENGLKVIYCFGQTLEERKGNKTWDVLETQLKPLLAAFPGESEVWQNNIVLAYEPVWAIGTGISSSPAQTKEVFDWLRTRLAKNIKNSAGVRIIYGGSANKSNAAEYLAIQSVDGLLVGGASLKSEFIDIVRICDEAK